MQTKLPIKMAFNVSGYIAYTLDLPIVKGVPAPPLPIGDSYAGSLHLSQIDPDVLAVLCEDFTNEVFKIAGVPRANVNVGEQEKLNQLITQDLQQRAAFEKLTSVVSNRHNYKYSHECLDDVESLIKDPNWPVEVVHPIANMDLIIAQRNSLVNTLRKVLAGTTEPWVDTVISEALEPYDGV